MFARYEFGFTPITVKLIPIQAVDIGHGDFNFLEELDLDGIVEEKILQVVSLESEEEQNRLIQEENEEGNDEDAV